MHRQERAIELTGRFYRHDMRYPSPIRVCTKRKGSLRFPVLEGHLESGRAPRCIHDVLIIVHDRRTRETFKFAYFFCRGKRLPRNTSLSRQARRLVLGDVIVMRVGSRIDAQVVNMRGDDRLLADWFVPK
jgi:hypothetical protein